MSQVEFPAILDIFKLAKSISQMSLHRGGGWGGVGWDTALQKLVSYMNNLIGPTYGHFDSFKMLPNRFLTSISTC